MKRIILILLILAGSFSMRLHAQHLLPISNNINPELYNSHWSAYWIAPPDVSLQEYGVYHFRKNFSLNQVPANFLVHVSADNRYKLYVNGEYIGKGPARGDLFNWRYETYDLAPYLKNGENLIAAEVWNFGKYIPWAQISLKTGFVLQGNSELEEVINTNQSWKVLQNKAYQPYEGDELNTFIVVGPGDEVDGNQFPWGWQKFAFNDSQWQQPELLNNPSPPGVGTDLFRMMVPRAIPMMAHEPQDMVAVRKTEGVEIDKEFLSGNRKLEIPANTTVIILFDQTYLTTAYPVLNIAGGKNAEMILTYAEALFDKNGRKGNRDVVEGKKIIGYQDKFISDGGENRELTTLWFRTFRYLKMEIKTQNQPLTINRFYSNFTAYPFQETASFNSDDPTLSKIWDVGWRTARLCAGETYFDCPYYEQLQYVGDTRIQALISLYVDGDDRLMKKAIELYDNSRLPFGLTMSRYPTSSPQVIPPYSLFWVAMIHDYYMHRPDLKFVENYLFGIQSVLQWYEEHLGEDGLLGPTPWWNFVDWTEEWPWITEKRIGGVPEGASFLEGGSSIISLQYAYSLMYAADLMDEFGKDELAKHYLNIARRVKQGVQLRCWNEEKGFYSDVPDESIYSQHANIMALLVDMIPQTKEKEFMQRVLDEPELIQTTFYYKYYLVRAMAKAGVADQYINQLEGWKDMLERGLTTFAEKPDPTRSDCHAWSASPNYDFLATVCGIMPASPGFKTVMIKPALGTLQEIEGEMPHPRGMIQVDLKRKGNAGITGTISLPEGVIGIFEWQGTKINLKGGKQSVQL